MNDATGRRPASKTYFTRPVLGFFAVLLAIVAAAVLINTSSWFQLRPASGSANAMSQAAVAPPTDTASER